MDVNNLVQTVAIYALPVLFAITLHEAAHGYVARHFGDMTAHAQGRISVNPIRHIDLVAQAGIFVNLIFMFLNLLPILPLDGGRILASLLPSRAAWQYARLEPWGLPLLVLLLVTNVLNFVLEPLVGASDALIRAIVF